jgi:hypothetical protein
MRRRRAVAEALISQKGRCKYCKSPLSIECATADHKIPASRGGTICRENVAAACETCNRVKADLPESYFFKLLNDKKPPKRGGAEMIMVWASRRIWRRAHKACDRLNRASLVRVASASSETKQGNDNGDRTQLERSAQGAG